MTQKLKYCSIYKLYSLAILFQIIIVSCFIMIDSFFIDSDSNQNDFFIDLMKNDPITYILVLVIIAPFLETLIFQALVIEIVLKVNKKAVKWAIVLSALVFGLAHSYNIFYVFATFIIGLFYAWLYVFFKLHRKENAFLFVSLIHLTNNLIAGVIDCVYLD